MPMTVDDYVKKKVLAKHLATVRMLRRLMRQAAPKAEEGFSYGMPVWKMQNIIAWMLPARDHVTFSFTRGVKFQDRYGLLQGAGKWARGLKLKSPRDVDSRVLTYYVRQAIAFDKK
jgi:hypothetical protein